MGPLVSDQTMPEVLAVDHFPDDVLARIKAELVPGERLLWAGRPSLSVDRASSQSWMIWFSGGLALSGVGLGMLMGAIPNGRIESVATLVASTGGCAILLCTFCLVISIKERWQERRKRQRVFYALSDRRAVCWLPSLVPRGVKVVTIPFRSIGSVHRIELDDGWGSVRFAGNIPEAEFAGFEGVPDVQRVEGLARNVLIDPHFRDFPDPTGPCETY